VKRPIYQGTILGDAVGIRDASPCSFKQLQQEKRGLGGSFVSFLGENPSGFGKGGASPARAGDRRTSLMEVQVGGSAVMPRSHLTACLNVGDATPTQARDGSNIINYYIALTIHTPRVTQSSSRAPCCSKAPSIFYFLMALFLDLLLTSSLLWFNITSAK